MLRSKNWSVGVRNGGHARVGGVNAGALLPHGPNAVGAGIQKMDLIHHWENPDTEAGDGFFIHRKDSIVEVARCTR